METLAELESLPRYVKVKSHIRAKIIDGSFSGRLPPEHQLAKDFGVSYMTVRRALGDLIDDGLVVREHGEGTFVSRPGNKRKLSRTILASLHRGIPGGLSNPYYAEILDGMEGECRRRGFSLAVTIGLDDEIAKFRQTGRFIPIKADGIVMPVSEHIRKELETLSRFIPVVYIGDWQRRHAFPSVGVDTCKAFHSLMAHLLKLGHRRIAFAMHNYECNLEREGRLRAWRESMANAGIPEMPGYFFRTDDTFKGGLAAAEHFLSLKERPTAIACHCDIIAAGVLKGFLERGVNIPDEISVTGFDDIPLAAQMHPGLTTVSIPKRELGERAAGLLLSLIESGPQDGETPAIDVGGSLVARGSSGAPGGRMKIQRASL